MQFGIFGSAQAHAGDLGPETGQGFRDYLDYAAEAEALGFQSSFLVEHHFTGWNQVSATLMLQTALAMRTTRLRLGTAVIVLPWHNPVLMAEQAATLDLISGGRLDFGIGKGYRHGEFRGFRIPPEEAEPRFEEAVGVIVKAFTSRERFSHQGRFWQFDDIVVEPPPMAITSATPRTTFTSVLAPLRFGAAGPLLGVTRTGVGEPPGAAGSMGAGCDGWLGSSVTRVSYS